MKKLALFLSLSFITGISHAQTDLSQQILACQAQTDSLQRLVCYDDIAKQLGKAPVSDETSVQTATSVATKVAAQSVQTVQPTLSTAEANFGQEAKVIKEVEEVRYVIKSAKLSVRKKWRFVFENGQQWEQKDSDRFAKYTAGEEVIIKRGVMNAFYLKKTDANRTIRVKRIK